MMLALKQHVSSSGGKAIRVQLQASGWEAPPPPAGDGALTRWGGRAAGGREGE